MGEVEEVESGELRVDTYGYYELVFSELSYDLSTVILYVL